MAVADEDFLIIGRTSCRFGRCPLVVPVEGGNRPPEAHHVRGESTMANYVLVYHGGSMPESPEDNARVMGAWTEWFGTLGEALVDGGNPATRSRTIAADGSVSDDTSGPSGYSIIKAASLDEAVTLARDCPVLHGGASVQVVETFDAM
jgi:hypothetical protein